MRLANERRWSSFVEEESDEPKERGLRQQQLGGNKRIDVPGLY